MKIDGACYCGEIAFEADVNPDSAVICHCTDCQATSGSAFRTIVPASAETFRVVSGVPKTYVKTAESGNRRELAFCAICGTHVWACDEGDDPGRISIRAGTVRQRGRLAPRRQIWCRSAQPWLADMGSLPRVERQPGSDYGSDGRLTVASARGETAVRRNGTEQANPPRR